MIRIGIVDPDTSHAREFAKYFAKHGEHSGCKLTGFLDESGLRSEAVLSNYADEFLLTRYRLMAELASESDALLLLSADWQRHFASAEYFVPVGKKVLIDKPLVGSLRDINKIQDLDREYPNMIFGGSALPHLAIVRSVRNELQWDAATSIEILGPRDSYFIGIHASEIAATLLPPDVDTSVRAQGDEIQIENLSGSSCRIRPSLEGWRIKCQLKERALDVALSTEGIYDDYLTTFVNFLHGDTSSNLSVPIAAVRLELAAARSEREGRAIRLYQLDDEDTIDAKDFLAAYQARLYRAPI